MFRRRMCEPRDVTQRFIAGGGCKVPRLQFGSEICIKGFGPVVGWCVRAQGAQVVDDVAASHDEYAFFAQRLEFTSQREVFNWWPGKIKGELKRGNICRWKQVHEDRPRAVIQAPPGIG